MVHYTLFGKPIVFDDGAERFFDLQYQSWTARDQAIEEFSKWYQSCGNIGAVLAQYRKFGGDLVEKFALKPLFSTLLDNGIFDVSQESYRAACLDTTDINEALRRIQSQYQQIERTQAAEEEYRQARKDNRGRWQGGGFGLGGALKGAAEAGALNMVSGLGHSMVNAVGNAGSAAAAASSKQALFKNQGTAETLFQGIESSLRTAYQAHMELVNRRKGAGYIRSTFDFDRSAALFENAKKLPERREELLVQAVTLCPWNQKLMQYVFLEYPDERKEICAIAKRFRVDLSAQYEEIFSKEYTQEAHESEEAAQQARERILQLMKEYSTEESTTLDQLEHDRLEILCAGVEQADEARCNELKKLVEDYKALKRNKEPFLDKIQARIQEIWSKEDCEVFDALYQKTDLLNPEAVKAAQAYIEQNGRTDDAKSYLDALGACTPDTIRAAKLYQHKSRPRLFRVLQWFSFAMFVLNWVWFHAGILMGIAFLVLWLSFVVQRYNLSEAWDKLTLKGRALHPAVTAELSPQEKRFPIGAWIWVVLLAAACVWTAYTTIHAAQPEEVAPPETEISDPVVTQEDTSQPESMPVLTMEAVQEDDSLVNVLNQNQDTLQSISVYAYNLSFQEIAPFAQEYVITYWNAGATDPTGLWDTPNLNGYTLNDISYALYGVDYSSSENLEEPIYYYMNNDDGFLNPPMDSVVEDPLAGEASLLNPADGDYDDTIDAYWSDSYGIWIPSAWYGNPNAEEEYYQMLCNSGSEAPVN
ncbi:hypothetical protein [uncultured Oscillibacter sp.]|uniref:hypothetical protein n=1 Tax=uncultured Oscillibacter sp. TaxID=876091 RepID=UPI002804188F|nr:hypothetical protein [uncultured Oscillibacter sp.]